MMDKRQEISERLDCLAMGFQNDSGKSADWPTVPCPTYSEPQTSEGVTEEMVKDLINENISIDTRYADVGNPLALTFNGFDKAAKEIHQQFIQPLQNKNWELSRWITKLGDSLIWTDAELKKSKEQISSLQSEIDTLKHLPTK